MIGLEKLSTIKAKLRQAFAAGGYNPIVDLDREIDELKISKSADAGELESLETFRRALAQVVDDKPAQSSRFSNEQRASKGSQEKGVAMRPKARSAKKEEIGQELEAQLRKSIAELDCAIRKLEKPAAAAGKAAGSDQLWAAVPHRPWRRNRQRLSHPRATSELGKPSDQEHPCSRRRNVAAEVMKKLAESAPHMIETRFL